MNLVFGLAWERGLEVVVDVAGSVRSTEGWWVEVARVVIREVTRARVEGRDLVVVVSMFGSFPCGFRGAGRKSPFAFFLDGYDDVRLWCCCSSIFAERTAVLKTTDSRTNGDGVGASILAFTMELNDTTMLLLTSW